MSEARATDPILVTGAGGFVGRHLLAHAAASGRAVLAATRTPDRIVSDPHIRTVASGPIDQVSTWRPLVDRCAAVVHLAAHAHRVGRDREEMDAFRRVNVEGTRALAEAVRDSGRPLRFVLMSSIGALNDCSEPGHPLNDDTVPAPQSNYGRSKLDAERALEAVLADAPCSWTALRPPLVYGPGSLGNMGRLERLVRLGLPLPLGSVHNQRSVMFVGNLASAVLAALDDPPARNRAFVVADHPPCSTPALIEAIAHATGRNARLVRCPPPLLRSLGRLGDLLQAAVRRPLPFSTYAVDRLLGSLAVDDRGFRAATGWSPPIGLEPAMRLSFAPTAP